MSYIPLQNQTFFFGDGLEKKIAMSVLVYRGTQMETLTVFEVVRINEYSVLLEI